MNFQNELMCAELTLKKADVSFAKELVCLVRNNQPEFKYIPFTQSLTSIVEAEKSLLLMQDKWHKKEQYCYFLFVSNHLIGYVGIKVRTGNHVAELSYYLDKAACKKGYTSCALSVLEDLFFKQGGHRLEIFCNENNHSSCALAKRLGYTLDGILREYEFLDDVYQGIAVYSKIAEK